MVTIDVAPYCGASFIKNIELISKKHVVVIAMLNPYGAAPLFFGKTVSSKSDIYAHLGGHIQWIYLRETEKVLKKHGIRFSLMESEKMSIQLVTQYINIKKRQVL